MGRLNWRIIAAILILIVLPAFSKDPFKHHLLIVSGIYIILAIGLNIIFLTGQLSIAHAAMMGIGAYTSSLLSLKLEIPVWFGIPAGALASGIIGFIIGLLVLRILGIYFAIVTFAVGQIVVSIFLSWISLFGGANGLLNIPSPTLSIPGLITFSFQSKLAYYYLVLIAVLIATLIFHRFNASYLGRAFRAIAISEKLAQSTGINVMYHKIVAFSVGNLLAGLAGALYAHYLHFIDPFFFAFSESVHIIVAVVIGGVGTLWGPIFGAVFVTFILEFLRATRALETIIYALILIIILLFMPEGLYGGFIWVKEKCRFKLSKRDNQSGAIKSQQSE